MRARQWALCAFFISSVAFGQAQEGVAQARFNKGRALFIKEQFEPALVEFRAASELYESPNTRLYIARCEQKLGHMATAYVEFQRAASEAADRARTDPRYASTSDVAKQEGAALEGKLAHVIIVTPAGLPNGVTITINDTPLGLASVGVPAPVDPGTVEIVATAPGYLRLHKSANIAAGESTEIKVQLAKEASQDATTTTMTTNDDKASDTSRDTTPSASHGLRNAGFVVGGIGIAGIGVFATFAGLAQSRFDQLKSQCGGACDASYSSQISEGQTFQLVANVALAAGGAALVTGAIMVIAGMSTGAAPIQAAFSPLPGGGWIAGVGRAF